MNETISSGLLATGQFGSWNVDIEEMTRGVQTLFGIVLTHSMLTLQFSIADISIINAIVDFLSNSNSSQFKIDGCLGGSLNWIFDEGRLCMRQITVGKLGESELFEVMITEGDRLDLIEALKDAVEDM